MAETIRCDWCGRTVGVLTSGPYAGCVVRHDNRNNSGFCKGSLLAARFVES